jgi:regulator of protease activity HflC (stomatin/prohibitin superfamily)
MSVQTEKYETQSSAITNDLQDVSTTIALNWKLDPGMSAEVYRTLGLEFIDRIAAPAIQETIKQITARYNAEDLILRREEVKNAITESLANRLRERGIITELVSITNFQFSDTFTAAIEAKVAAEQAVLEATNKLERVKVEAQQREAEARGEADARIAKAKGEAEYIRVVTEAQVVANQAISESLTPEILQYILLDRLGEDIKIMVIPSGQGLDLVLPELLP